MVLFMSQRTECIIHPICPFSPHFAAQASYFTFYMTFDQLGLIPTILSNIAREGYTQPTPIQEQAIPDVLKGRDILASAQTGTGKTAAFCLPILQLLAPQARLEQRQRGIKALILSPTRELAGQIADSLTAYGRNLNLRHTVIYGGVSQRPQTDALRRRVDIVVATPGRLMDLMEQGHVRLNEVSMLVLDEADRMLDMGFIHDINAIIDSMPKQRQTLFFSATMPPEIVKLANRMLVDPIRVAVTPGPSAVEIIDQRLYHVERDNKRELLLHLLHNEVETALVFTKTKHGAEKVATMISRSGIPADSIHGDKSQAARQAALRGFKQGRTRVLVATDVAARGIDIDALSHVINFEVPHEAETYVHRIGRTGRAGNSGIALTLCDREERKSLKLIHKLIAKQLPVVEDHPFAIATPIQDDRKPIPAPSRRGGKFGRPGGFMRKSGSGRRSVGSR
jgi:ATP-dependent RNA helicase RhlE